MHVVPGIRTCGHLWKKTGISSHPQIHIPPSLQLGERRTYPPAQVGPVPVCHCPGFPSALQIWTLLLLGKPEVCVVTGPPPCSELEGNFRGIGLPDTG